MLGESALDFIHPDDRDRGIQSWMEMLAGRSGGRYRIRVRTKAGDYRWLEISNVSRLGDPDAGYVETEMVDVDDEMNALAKVRAGERQFKTLTESLPVGVVQVDTEARVVFANEWIRRLTGLLGERWADDADLVDGFELGDWIRPVLPGNFLGIPGAVTPGGLSEGLPVGVQVIGDRFTDLRCLSVAEEIESLVGTLTPIDPASSCSPGRAASARPAS